MRAKTVNEVNFERGRNPKEAMGLGDNLDRIRGKMQEIQKRIGGEISEEDFDDWGKQRIVWTLDDSPKLDRGGQVVIIHKEKDPIRSVIKEYEVQGNMGFISGANMRRSTDHQQDAFKFLDDWLDKWFPIEG
jgi:hypothetical protein